MMDDRRVFCASLSASFARAGGRFARQAAERWQREAATLSAFARLIDGGDLAHKIMAQVRADIIYTMARTALGTDVLTIEKDAHL